MSKRVSRTAVARVKIKRNQRLTERGQVRVSRGSLRPSDYHIVVAREDRRKTASWTTSGENGFLTPKHAPTHPRTHAYAVTVDRAVHMTGETRSKSREGGGRGGRRGRTWETFSKQIRTFTRHSAKHGTHADTRLAKRETHTHTHQRRSTDGESHTWRENAIRDAGEGSRGREREKGSRTFAGNRRDWQRGRYAHIRRKRTQCGSGRGAARRGATRCRALRRTGIRPGLRLVRRPVEPPWSTRRRCHRWRRNGPAGAGSAITRNRARDSGQRGKGARPSSRGPPGFADLSRDTCRSTGRETRPARLRVALLTYASHVGRSSRLPAQRVQNISATLTCAANTMAAILESHSTIATDQARTGATPRGSSRGPHRHLACEVERVDR